MGSLALCQPSPRACPVTPDGRPSRPRLGRLTTGSEAAPNSSSCVLGLSPSVQLWPRMEWSFPGRGRCTVSTALIQSACKQTHLTPVIGGRSEDISQEGVGFDPIRKCSPRSKIYTLKSLIMWHGDTLDAFFFALAGRDEPHGQRQKIQLISHIRWHNVAFDWGGELETAQTALQNAEAYDFVGN